MFKKIKSFIEDVKFYKSLGPDKTYIQTVERHLASGAIAETYLAVYMTNPWIEWKHSLIHSNGGICLFSQYNYLYEFTTEREAKDAVDAFLDRKKREDAKRVVKTTSHRKGYP